MSTNDDFLPERKPNNTIYISIYEGKICQRKSVETPGFVRYESILPKSKGKVSYIKEFECINGYVTGFERREKETLDGTKYMVARVTFESTSGKEAIFETPIRGEFVAKFAKCAENINFEKQLQVFAFLDRKNNHTKVYFKQNGEKIDQKYTNENPGGLPQWEKDPMTGQHDTRDYWKFLFNIISAHALPLIRKTKEMLDAYHQGEEVDAAEDFAEVSPSDDDIPF